MTLLRSILADARLLARPSILRPIAKQNLAVPLASNLRPLNSKALLHTRGPLSHSIYNNALGNTSAAAATAARRFSSLRTVLNTAKTAAGTVDASQAAEQAGIKSAPSVAYWLIGTSGLVFGIVILGGLTRLTESGLSITEWKPVTGALPPMSQADWEEEFRKYRESPEYKQLNAGMSLDDFKFIFFMEWFHRLWGRAIGVVFVLPAIYFMATKKTSSQVNKRLIALGSLLALQGFIGWWMVESGLDQKQLDARRSKPTVSQYRLTTHLATACLLYLGMLTTGFDILRENKWFKNPGEALKVFGKLDNPAVRSVRLFAAAMLVCSFVTALSGGMVAGLDAGFIYNTWPKMGDRWMPTRRELMDPAFARKEDKSDLWWRNVLENPTTVQLVHRDFAYLTFLGIFALHMLGIKRKAFVPSNAQWSMRALMGLVTLQITLGVFTLLTVVQTHVAATHQAGALAVLTSALILVNQMKRPRVAVRNVINSSMASRLNNQASSRIMSEASKLVSK